MQIAEVTYVFLYTNIQRFARIYRIRTQPAKEQAASAVAI